MFKFFKDKGNVFEPQRVIDTTGFNYPNKEPIKDGDVARVKPQRGRDYVGLVHRDLDEENSIDWFIGTKQINNLNFVPPHTNDKILENVTFQYNIYGSNIGSHYEA